MRCGGTGWNRRAHEDGHFLNRKRKRGLNRHFREVPCLNCRSRRINSLSLICVPFSKTSTEWRLLCAPFFSKYHEQTVSFMQKEEFEAMSVCVLLQIEVKVSGTWPSIHLGRHIPFVHIELCACVCEAVRGRVGYKEGRCPHIKYTNTQNTDVRT